LNKTSDVINKIFRVLVLVNMTFNQLLIVLENTIFQNLGIQDVQELVVQKDGNNIVWLYQDLQHVVSLLILDHT
jgi:hypothetical protein